MHKLTRRGAAMMLGLGFIAMPTFASPENDTEGARFKAIYEGEWEWRKKQIAAGEDSTGDHVDAHLPDVSATAQAARLKVWQGVATQLEGIDPAKLSSDDQTNYAVYKAQIQSLITEKSFRLYERPLSGDTSFWGDLADTARRSFKDEEDYRNYISQMSEFPRYFAQNIDNMRSGLKRGFTPPAVTLKGRDATVESVLGSPTIEDNIYYTPFKTMPSQMSAATQKELRVQGISVIRDGVIPAHRSVLAFLRKEYMPLAQPSIAAYDLPDGKAFYRAQVKYYTTLDMSPDDIHAIGLAEVASLKREMLDIKQEVKFSGELPAFLNFLRTDPQFYVTTPQALLDRAAWIAKTFDGKAKDYFGRLPRSRFAIIPVPADIAPFYTGGRGGPGVYLLNTYNLPARPLYSLPALTLHESAPGHAFQMPLAAENKSLPAFRQNTFISAYGEGWALYCERLGLEMGMYGTPYERFGMLSYQMWRACRLAVDTGVHTLGWTRAQAQAYLHDNTALSDHEIETEVDRYIAWPAQALSYYLGEMSIWKCRHKAEAALGPAFNIRAFHDTVLSLGSVPLPVLESRIDVFISSGGKGPYPDEE